MGFKIIIDNDFSLHSYFEFIWNLKSFIVDQGIVFAF